ncbi:DNA sulfur modification protein DndE [Sinomicrobium oceani]|uniref:DNA sulfur modification protein DndE n=1 Tax=Sinomicrobium oceani TaxID=1150368 RepID=A0A1K1RXE4_9FLAO|nr:DndE family protein [Sinomicrobium oceani]SFW76626.1 DNA sulfur modification protein DndE [Sinomicrobium oceani]
MFTQVKTSKENKEIVTLLTQKLNLGTENVIARMAYSYSLSLNRKLDLNDIADSGGKEYAKSVLFGEYYDIYIGLLCVNYNIYKTDKDIAKYIKLHIDDGLQLLYEEFQNNSHEAGFDFVTNLITEKIEYFS